MGIIVGSETWVECDEIGCRNKSVSHYDQRQAVELARDKGWYISPNTGKATCPKCRLKEEGKWQIH